MSFLVYSKKAGVTSLSTTTRKREKVTHQAYKEKKGKSQKLTGKKKNWGGGRCLSSGRGGATPAGSNHFFGWRKERKGRGAMQHHNVFGKKGRGPKREKGGFIFPAQGTEAGGGPKQKKTQQCVRRREKKKRKVNSTTRIEEAYLRIGRGTRVTEPLRKGTGGLTQGGVVTGGGKAVLRKSPVGKASASSKCIILGKRGQTRGKKKTVNFREQATVPSETTPKQDLTTHSKKKERVATGAAALVKTRKGKAQLPGGER